MLIEDFAVKRVTPHTLRVSWTAPDDTGIGYVYVDGALAASDVTGDTERSATVPIGADVVAISVHHLEEGIEPTVQHVRPGTRPTLHWCGVSDAYRYRVYHTAPGEDEVCIIDMRADGRDGYSVRCPIELDGTGGKWHQFRVEAIDESGNESSTTAFKFWAYGLPVLPSEIAVSGTAGNMTITITP